MKTVAVVTGLLGGGVTISPVVQMCTCQRKKKKREREDVIKIMNPISGASCAHSSRTRQSAKNILSPLSRCVYKKKCVWDRILVTLGLNRRRRSEDPIGRRRPGDRPQAGRVRSASSWEKKKNLRWLPPPVMSHGDVLVTRPYCWTHNVSLWPAVCVHA